MNKKIIISAVIIGIIAVVAVIALNNTIQSPETGSINNNQNNNVAEVVQVASENKSQIVKEFEIESFVEFIDGKPKPQFSLKEITVNKGDLVRIKITNIKGTHDFKLDEFGVFADTPLNQKITVEFMADKTGEFIYYCNQPGHRANGQFGTLKVI